MHANQMQEKQPIRRYKLMYGGGSILVGIELVLVVMLALSNSWLSTNACERCVQVVWSKIRTLF